MIAYFACVVGCVFAGGGCRREPGTGASGFSPAGLAAAALQTHTRYVSAVNAGTQTPSDEIPSKYWASQVRELRPIRVYQHRSNIVVVQKESPGRQEGKYVNIVISSYLPQSGEDGFTFTEIGDGVYDFIRAITD
jgi:hypothetical protein